VKASRSRSELLFKGKFTAPQRPGRWPGLSLSLIGRLPQFLQRGFRYHAQAAQRRVSGASALDQIAPHFLTAFVVAAMRKTAKRILKCHIHVCGGAVV
jgi:hypothetical protein